VHTRLTYLRHLIVSLAQARDIERTLLVFSHDYYDEEINNLVKTIDFTKVMQIFYPYSIQTHPNEFPGVDPKDCPRDAKFEHKVQKLLQTTKHLLYPKRLTATISPGGAKHNKRLVKGNGGWGDVRDHELCANMTKVGRQQRKYIYYS
ncbi:hypothetical protein MSG28_015990, partial [Choristoneura fumiferana]